MNKLKQHLSGTVGALCLVGIFILTSCETPTVGTYIGLTVCAVLMVVTTRGGKRDG